ncbi:hypothetical protein ScPMuIL_008286 [Solemya velum]
MTLGLCLAIFCCGIQILHLVIQSTVCLILLKVLHGRTMAVCVFVVSLLYLSVFQIHRAYIKGLTDLIDVSGPMMIMTQKISSLAFNLYDGKYRASSQLTDIQKKNPIREMPSALQYYSYLFHFHGIIVGPMCFYSDYISFVEGTELVKHQKKIEASGITHYAVKQRPSPVGTVSQKLLTAGFWLLVHLTFTPHFPVTNNSDAVFIRDHGWIYRLLFMLASMILARAKFYISWTLADAVNNASGFGFNGYDEKGKPRWDLITNIKILKLEFAMSTKTFIENWNIQTTVWLRLVCYDRVPVLKTLLTFMLSGLWHGFYPGYYFTFLFGTFCTAAGRKVHRNIRPLFLEPEKKKLVYDIVTWFCTQLTIAYLAVPFTILYTQTTLDFYNSFYWCFHIAVISISLVIPNLPRKSAENTSEVTKSLKISGVHVREKDIIGKTY